MDEPALEFEKAIIAIDSIRANNLIQNYHKDFGVTAAIENIVLPVMEKMGIDWEKGNIALSQIYMGGKICEESVNLILPPADPLRKSNPRMAILTYNDYHMLGKRIVYTMLRATGYELIDYGRVDDEHDLINMIKKDKVEVLLISVLMLNSAKGIKKVTDLIKKEDLDTRVIVGGAPFRFDRNLCSEIGAFAMVNHAGEIVGKITEILEVNHA